MRQGQRTFSRYLAINPPRTYKTQVFSRQKSTDFPINPWFYMPNYAVPDGVSRTRNACLFDCKAVPGAPLGCKLIVCIPVAGARRWSFNYREVVCGCRFSRKMGIRKCWLGLPVRKSRDGYGEFYWPRQCYSSSQASTFWPTRSFVMICSVFSGYALQSRSVAIAL